MVGLSRTKPLHHMWEPYLKPQPLLPPPFTKEVLSPPDWVLHSLQSDPGN